MIHVREAVDTARQPIGLAKGFMRSPASGTLSLNPSVDRDARSPRCPDCHEPIRGIDTASDTGTIEFRCGCDDLQRFEISNEETP